MARRVEIVGGGIGGLSAAIMFAKAGWSVRVHERSPMIREAGAGIYLRNNSLEPLMEFGLYDELAAQGSKIERSMSVDRDGALRQEIVFSDPQVLLVVPRQALVDVLAKGARDVGVEIALGSEAVDASPEGELSLKDGSRCRADLIVVADGFRSKLRDRLVPAARARELNTSVNRHFLPNRDIAKEPLAIQYWSGNRRVGISPSGDNHTYVYSICHVNDERGRRLPLDVEDWTRAFPLLRDKLPAIAEAPVTQYRYVMVNCPKWHVGKVAIIGDAAHGLPPTLGQGAGLAIMNSKALVMALDMNKPTPEALDFWEKEVRFISDRTQRWSSRYDLFTRSWPTSLESLRPAVFWAFTRFPLLNYRMRVAERGLRETAFGN